MLEEEVENAMIKNAICNFEDYYSIQVCKDYFKSLFHVQTGKVLLAKPVQTINFRSYLGAD